MRIVCLSDTHCRLRNVTIPSGDVLVLTGDLTFVGNIEETSQELRELGRHKKDFKEIVICEGNHDWLGQRNPELMGQLCKDNNITLLRDSGTTIDGIKFWGSPWQPEFCNWAWNLPRLGKELQEKWTLIPADTEVLLTHGPPHGVLDGVERFNGQLCEWQIENLGCFDLWNRVQELQQLKLHVFGHLHFGYGQIKKGKVTFVNASTCNEQYKPINPPIVIDI